jgi:hypothetical protein
MKSFLVVLCSLFLLSLTSCNQAPTFITRTGTFELFHGKVTVEVFGASEDLITYRVARPGAAAIQPQRPPIQKGTAWFLYPSGTNSIWIYPGDDHRVDLIELDGQGFKMTTYVAGTDLLQKAPAKLLDRLPPTMRGQ